ncbi:MAG: four helix bundle protein [Candidatus Woesearchaeota archaeon]
MMQDYKKLNVWEESHKLNLEINKALKKFPATERFALAPQLWRASFSITANIVEGSGKYSQKDFAKFLQISLGSARELEYYLLLAKDLKYITEINYVQLNDKIDKICAMLANLIKTIRTNDEQISTNGKR